LNILSTTIPSYSRRNSEFSGGREEESENSRSSVVTVRLKTGHEARVTVDEAVDNDAEGDEAMLTVVMPDCVRSSVAIDLSNIVPTSILGEEGRERVDSVDGFSKVGPGHSNSLRSKCTGEITEPDIGLLMSKVRNDLIELSVGKRSGRRSTRFFR